MITKIICVALVISIYSAEALPTAIFHGLGDDCIYPGMHSLTKKIERETGAYAECIRIGISGTLSSWFESFEKQAEKACEKILANPHFNNTRFNVMGLSQGGLIARYIAETCPTKDYVNNMLTLGGPHMGVDKIPHCFNGVICDAVNDVIDDLVYTKLAQFFVGPAGYFRNPKDMKDYEKTQFLPALNNEIPHTNLGSNKDRFINLNAIMLVMFSEDTMVHPKESEQFASLDTQGNLIKMEDQEIYKTDAFGLKTVNEAGKIKFVEVQGNHLQFTQADVSNIFVPFLVNGVSYEDEEISPLSFELDRFVQ